MPALPGNTQPSRPERPGSDIIRLFSPEFLAALGILCQEDTFRVCAGKLSALAEPDTVHDSEQWRRALQAKLNIEAITYQSCADKYTDMRERLAAGALSQEDIAQFAHLGAYVLERVTQLLATAAPTTEQPAPE